MIGPLLTLIRGEPGMAERILAVHVDDGSGRCRRCVAHDRPAAVHPCLIRVHALWAVDMQNGRITPDPGPMKGDTIMGDHDKPKPEPDPADDARGSGPIPGEDKGGDHAKK